MAKTGSVILKIRPATTLLDFMRVRRIRNSCKDFMTRDRSHIGYRRQLLFFLRYYIAKRRMNILYVGENEEGRPIAYGLISYDENLDPWISGGILPEYRGKGYGFKLFEFLADWHISVFLEVLEGNTAAKKLYDRLGFVETSRISGRRDKKGTSLQETVITMKKRPALSDR